MMGDAVNLSARLMQAAQPGEILVNESTQKATGDVFAWDAGQPLQVKGKEEPVQVYRLLGLARQTTLQLQAPSYALPMVGRAAELQLIQQKLAQAQAGQGQIVGITAEAGMGKSRLAAEVIKLALEAGFAGYGGECLSHGVNTSYLVWHNVLRGLFGLDPGWSVADQAKYLEMGLAVIDPALLPRLPLLGRALNLTLPDNELTQAMDAKLRKESLESLVVDFVRWMGGTRPLLLVLEDCHWIDALSRDLLTAVARNIAAVPVMIIVVYRPPATANEQLPIIRLSHFQEIALTEFTPAEAEKLIGLKLTRFFGSLGSIPAEFVEQVLERAQGNPFYIDEMLNLVRDRGIDPTDRQALVHLQLPDSLHSVIISRLDRLAEDAKSTLKVASVIGRLFRADWLWDVYPQLGSPERIKEQLVLLNKMDITPVEQRDSEEMAYLFKHILTREVAYESLALATRQMLHEQIGLYIERRFSDSLGQFVDLLAHHFGLSQNVAKQKEYLALAGQAAQAAYANDAAIAYYQALLPLLKETERGPVLMELGTVLQLIGRWDDAQSRYKQALTLAKDAADVALQARSEYLLGSLARARGVFAEAENRLRQAFDHFTAVSDSRGAANAEMEMGIIDWSQGNYTEALARYENCLETYQELGDQSGVCRAIGNMGIVHWTLGDFNRALGLYQQYQTIADEIGDKLGLSRAMGNMGNVYLDLGNYQQALKYFIDNLHVALELGYRQGISISVANMGEVYEKQGDYQRALPCYRFNLAADLELGDRYGVAYALWSLAKAYAGQGNYETAVALLQLAIQIGRLLDIPYELSDFLFTQAEILSWQERRDEALAVLAETLSLAAAVNHPQVQLEARLLQLRLEGQSNEAALLGLLTPDLDEAQQAAVQYEICLLDSGGTMG
ncbi:MAG: tetratricopeptide repeat protein, partial [Anaerolineae bacterium]